MLPPGSQRDLVDPFAEKKSSWPAIVIVLLILAGAGGFWYYGKLDNILPPNINSVSALGTNSPAFTLLGTNAPGWKALGTNAPGYVFILSHTNAVAPVSTNAPAAK
jgi:hypothetical protein